MSHTDRNPTPPAPATSPANLHLVHRPGRVFETLGFDEHWAEGGYDEGRTVTDDSAPMQALLAEFHFIMPRLQPETPGIFPILTVTRDRPPGSEPEVFLQFSYEPSEERFLVGSGTGFESSEPQVFPLEGAGVKPYTRRVLRGFVLIAPDAIYPSLEDPFTQQQELFGRFPVSGHGDDSPWGKSARGKWHIRSGAEEEESHDQSSFPAGFGLADVRVTVFSSADGDFETLPYSGSLDHLVSASWDDVVNPFGPDEDWDFGDDASMSSVLFDLADQLFTLSGGVNTWACRAKGLAEETEQLARLVPEEPFDLEGGEAEEI